MKPWSIGVFLLVLTGCAQNPQLQEQELVSHNEAAPSCVTQLSQWEGQINTYVRTFQTCEEPISDEALVRRYVYALIASGQYQVLLSGSAFSEYVDVELAQYWTNWAKEVFQ
ncbi:hypothetical protein C4G95_RS23040 [Vibrio parahaemolyticus]|nr:hypothetical protein [Vibrio parahaemolyticus]EIA1343589.1 hypothetical protein [Vibrio parahaemolyticus]EIA1590647.1 hypothetical protein [Vibrio parahaemolyticus]EIA1769758.1 hypothetical protein [Vibrio parahaemolyticus]EJG0961860.1 hypothetical protein [Vibrio parahaemolyticus]